MGIQTGNVLVVSADLPLGRYPNPEQRASFYDRLTARLETVPGVESVGLSESLPSWNTRRVAYELAGAPVTDSTDLRRPRVSAMKISAEYFRTLGATMLSGRDFDNRDTASGLRVAIVNQAFASKFWPGEDPLGKRLRLLDGDTTKPWLTVVAVVSNIIQNDQTRQRFEPLVYLPYRQEPGGGMWIMMRTRIAPAGMTNAVRRQIQALDPDLPIYGPLPLADRLERYWDNRFYGMLFLIFAVIALLLASIGLYTVVAHSVSRRTQEIGIRMAVGATARDILGLVLRQGMLPLGVGLAIGLAGSLAVNRVLKDALVKISPTDPVTLVVASAVLIVAATLGCVIPARRAIRVDPLVALRHE
jgi:putative ABC transport system permease protein